MRIEPQFGQVVGHAIPGIYDRLRGFRSEVLRLWYRSLRRRSQRYRLNGLGFCERFSVLLPPLQVLQPYRNARFDAEGSSIRGKNRVR